MENYSSRELARGKCQTPSYAPYIAAGVSASPWPVPSAEHTAAVANWKPNNQEPKPGDRPPPFHSWALYLLRFMIAADLCADWLPYGGLSPQLNNLSIILHLSNTEAIAVALSYDSIPPIAWRN